LNAGSKSFHSFHTAWIIVLGWLERNRCLSPSSSAPTELLDKSSLEPKLRANCAIGRDQVVHFPTLDPESIPHGSKTPWGSPHRPRRLGFSCAFLILGETRDLHSIRPD
jgi:hypothetical protein